MQEDHSCPPQLYLKFKDWIWKILKFYILRKFYNIFNYEHETFFDDMEILRKNCNLDF